MRYGNGFLTAAFVRIGKLGVIIVALYGMVNTANADVWSDSFSSDSGERFIPIELFTGMPWDGSRDFALTKATPDDRARMKISGPEDFIRPNTGEMLRVYRRSRTQWDGREVVQLFAVTSREDGLGRVYDSRYSRNCVDAVKFPLGIWRQGETRDFREECENRHRAMSVTIEEIDFSYNGVAHSLKFRWVADGGHQRGTDNTYIFSPNRGYIKSFPHTN